MRPLFGAGAVATTAFGVEVAFVDEAVILIERMDMVVV